MVGPIAAEIWPFNRLPAATGRSIFFCKNSFSHRLSNHSKTFVKISAHSDIAFTDFQHVPLMERWRLRRLKITCFINNSTVVQIATWQLLCKYN